MKVTVTEINNRFVITNGIASHDISSNPNITSPERLEAHVAGFCERTGCERETHEPEMTSISQTVRVRAHNSWLTSDI